jgi:hypothetical protein
VPNVHDTAEYHNYQQGLGTTQNVQEGRLALGHRHHVFRFWKWEAFTIVLCLGLVTAIFAILGAFEGQQAPEWGHAINLSTLLALLATILRASLVAIVSEILSHTKWSWFATGSGRPLRYLDDFENASRGAIGAAYLIPSVVGRSPVAFVSTLVIIVSFATGPFVQQAIKTKACSHVMPGFSASIPVAHYVPGTSNYYRIGAGLFELEVDMKGAMIAGITNPQGNDSKVQVNCATGDCTFPAWGKPTKLLNPDKNHDKSVTHATLGLCSRCEDVSSFVVASNETAGYLSLRLPVGGRTYFMPDSPFLNVQAFKNISMFSSMISPEIAREGAWGLTFSLVTATNATCSKDSASEKTQCPYGSMTGTNGWNDFLAATCSLYPCLRSYSASVSRGVLSEELLQTTPLLPDFEAKADAIPAGGEPAPLSLHSPLTAIQVPCRLDDGTIYTSENISTGADLEPVNIWSNPDGLGWRFIQSKAPKQCVYRLLSYYYMAVDSFLYDLFNGTCTYQSGQGDNLNCGRKFWLENLYSKKGATMNLVSGMVDDFALAVTTKFRETGSRYNPGWSQVTVMNVTKDVISGMAWQVSVCTLVDWKWLLLPAILTATCALLLAAVIIRSWKRRYEEPVWKSSVLPLLLYKESFTTSAGLPLGHGRQAGAYAGDGQGNVAQDCPLMDMTEVRSLSTQVVARFDGMQKRRDVVGHNSEMQGIVAGDENKKTRNNLGL